MQKKKKLFKVKVQVKEIITKSTIAEVMATNQTKACGAAEYAVDESPENYEFTKPVSKVEIMTSTIVEEEV